MVTYFCITNHPKSYCLRFNNYLICGYEFGIRERLGSILLLPYMALLESLGDWYFLEVQSGSGTAECIGGFIRVHIV